MLHVDDVHTGLQAPHWGPTYNSASNYAMCMILHKPPFTNSELHVSHANNSIYGQCRSTIIEVGWSWDIELVGGHHL